MTSFATNPVPAEEPLCSRELMQEAVAVMNEAIHNEPVPINDPNYESLGEKLSNGRTLEVQVFSAQDMAARDSVAIRFDTGKVKLLPAEQEAAVDASVKVCEEHLRELCNNPDSFIDDPLKIEVIWLKDRLTA